MGLQIVKHTTILSTHEQPDAAFYLVSRLLLETLAENNEEVTINASSGDFYHDPETRIQSTGSISVVITDASLTESGTRTEISVSGVIERQSTAQCNYTLYFIMERDVAIIPSRTNHLENVIGRALVMRFKQSSKNLYNSLFNLSLDRVNAQGEDYRLGEGRGFLVFAENEPITDN